MDLHLTLFLPVLLATLQVMNLGAIYSKRLFRSETKFEGYASSGTAVFAVPLLEQTAILRHDVLEI